MLEASAVIACFEPHYFTGWQLFYTHNIFSSEFFMPQFQLLYQLLFPLEKKPIAF